ncbi:CoxG family protein [Tepidamorphus sp. 3E244]|uniref:CoxG family protein n=1 Tax=Tepidamorphus sp. 3E244 TaxID=3385498 RepID=UPI0038FD2B17
MQMNGEYELPADKETVWQALNDPDVLGECIPGCESFERDGENGFKAVAVQKIGPVKARFAGNVELTDIDPPNGYRISGEGSGGVAGFAKGGANVHLRDAEGGGTVLSYDVDAQIGGKIAQLGQRLVNGAAKKVADQFFENFRKILANEDV